MRINNPIAIKKASPGCELNQPGEIARWISAVMRLCFFYSRFGGGERFHGLQLPIDQCPHTRPEDLRQPFHQKFRRERHQEEDGHRPISFGCVVLGVEEAQLLYAWADVGTPVVIQW